MARLMGHRDHKDCLVSNCEEDGIGEASGQGTPNSLVDQAILQGTFRDRGEGGLYGFAKRSAARGD
jgi:hypothetical protein